MNFAIFLSGERLFIKITAVSYLWGQVNKGNVHDLQISFIVVQPRCLIKK